MRIESLALEQKIKLRVFISWFKIWFFKRPREINVLAIKIHWTIALLVILTGCNILRRYRPWRTHFNFQAHVKVKSKGKVQYDKYSV
jgi:hypothetical protein